MIYKLIICLLLFISFAFSNSTPNKVSVQLLWKNQFEFAGFYIAKEKGFYKDVNLDVTIKEFQQNTNIVKDVEKGISTFGVGYTSLILEKSHGTNIVLLNTLLQSSPHILVALDKSGIKSINDFKNKRIMMESDARTNAAFLSMLYSKKVTIDEMEVIKPSFDIYDLINENVDIFSAYSSNELYILDSLKIKYKVFDPTEYGFDFYNDFLFTSSSLAKKNPELINRFQQATIKGWMYAYSHIDETANLIYKKYNSQNKSESAFIYEANVLKELSFKKNIPFGNIQKTKIERIKDVYALMGLIKKDFNLDNLIFDNSKVYLSNEEKKFIKDTQINISISKNFRPISFQDNEKNPSGIATEYWKILTKDLHLKEKYIFNEVFSDQLNQIKEKKADIILSAAKTAKREDYALFTNEYIRFPISIATKNKQNFIEDFSKVIHKKIAVGRNFSAHKLLIERYPNINFVFVENIKEGLELVRKEKVFGFVEMKPILLYQIKKYKFDDISITGNTGTMFDMSIMIRKDYPLLHSVINKAIYAFDKSKLNDIIKAYENLKFEKTYDYKAFLIMLSILLLLFLFIISRHYILNKVNKKLQIKVEEKTKKLKELNETLEERIEQAIEDNSKKDAILYQQTKNAQMGEMIGNIAHQWRQPLSLISTAASGILAQKEFGTITEEKEKEALDAIIEKVNFLSATIDTFRDYIKEKKEIKKVLLQDRLKNDINIIEASLSNNYIVLLSKIDDCEPIYINMLVGELSQVVINILNNAKDVLVERKIESPIIKISLLKQNDKAIINIEDNAGGIKDDILSKIFNPYFTTKHQSLGTGLGLYMSKEIIEKHLKGKIYVQNTKIGAQFTIELPIEQ